MKIKNREFFDDDFYKKMLMDYEDIRHRRKNMKGKPDVYDRIILDMDKMFESFYKKFLDL